MHFPVLGFIHSRLSLGSVQLLTIQDNTGNTRLLDRLFFVESECKPFSVSGIHKSSELAKFNLKVGLNAKLLLKYSHRLSLFCWLAIA